MPLQSEGREGTKCSYSVVTFIIIQRIKQNPVSIIDLTLHHTMQGLESIDPPGEAPSLAARYLQPIRVATRQR
tara:strand:- start:495 stop:713 length:219 start_codon:yes stop_codon:yes gene_type:complete